MGLFTKKIYTCRQCGKEYEARINLSGGLCKECSDKREQDRKEISGYLEYGLKTNRDYKEDVWKDIAMHRDPISYHLGIVFLIQSISRILSSSTSKTLYMVP